MAHENIVIFDCCVKFTAHIQISLNVLVDIWSTAIWAKHGMVVHRHNSECHAHACLRTHTHTHFHLVRMGPPTINVASAINTCTSHQGTVLFSVCVKHFEQYDTESTTCRWTQSDMIQGKNTHSFFVKSIMMLSEPLWQFCTGLRSTARPRPPPPPPFFFFLNVFYSKSFGNSSPLWCTAVQKN